MATIGELLINIKAGTASFVSDLQKVKALSFTTADEIGRSFQVLGAAGVGMLAVFGGAMAVMMDKTTEAAAQMGRMAQSAGTTTEKMSALSFVGKMVGLDADTMALAMERLDKKLLGVTASAKMLAEMKDWGLTPDIVKTSDDALLALADHFAQLPSLAEKSAVAMDFFGKAGATMIPVLNLGRQGIQDFMDEAKALGVVIDGPTAAAAEHFQQNLTILEQALNGVALQVMEHVLPNLIALTDAVVKTMENHDRFKMIIDTLVWSLKAAADVAITLVSGFLQMVEGARHFGDSMGILGKEVVDVFKMMAAASLGNMVQMAAAYDKFITDRQAMDDMNAQHEATRAGIIATQLDMQAQLWGKGTSAMSAQNVALGTLGGSTDKLTAAQKALAKQLEEMNKQLDVSKATFGETQLQVELYRLKMDGATQADMDAIQAKSTLLARMGDLAKLDSQTQDLQKERDKATAIAATTAAMKADTDAMELNISQWAALSNFAPTIFPQVTQTSNVASSAIKEQTDALKDQIATFGMTANALARYRLEEIAGADAGSQSFKDEMSNLTALQAQLLQTQLKAQNLRDAWKTFGETALKSLDDLIFSGKKFTQVLADVTKQLGEMFLKWALFGQNGQGGIFGSIFSGLSGGGGIGGLLGGLFGGGGTASAGAIDFTGAAAGGGVTGGVPILVGEKGPEIFTPDATGYITPNHEISTSSGSGSGGGATVIYNIDARGADAGAEMRIRAALKSTEDRAVQRALLMSRDAQLRTG